MELQIHQFHSIQVSPMIASSHSTGSKVMMANTPDTPDTPDTPIKEQATLA
jgi:hypothetical protein